MSSAVLSRFARSFQAAASSRQCTTDDLFDLEKISEEWGRWNNWQQKSSRGGQSYHSMAGSGEGAQDSCRRAQAKSSPEVLAVLFFLALISCCAECVAISSAATSIAGQPCSAQDVEGLLHRPGNQALAGYPDLGAPVATPPWKSTAQQIESAKKEEKKTQDRMERMSRNVQRFARRSRQRKPAEQPSGKLFPISRRSCSQSPLLRQLWDSADEATRSSDLFSAICRVIFPDLTPSRSSFPVQMEMETPQFKHQAPSDHEISDVEQLDTETEAEQLERLMHIQAENSQLVPSRKKAPKKLKS